MEPRRSTMGSPLTALLIDCAALVLPVSARGGRLRAGGVRITHTRTDAGTHAGSRGRSAASQVQGEQVCERCGKCHLRLRPMTSGCPTSQVSLAPGPECIA